MHCFRRGALSLIVMLALLVGGCSCDEEAPPGQSGHEEEGGEESGTELALDQTYDRIRNGAHLVLAYSAEANIFAGTVTNTTDEVLKRVRVEVHLSNGRELGPTTPTDLAPGQALPVKLVAESTGFTGWTAHPEVGSDEHGPGGEHGGREHDREGEGEHGGGHR